MLMRPIAKEILSLSGGTMPSLTVSESSLFFNTPRRQIMRRARAAESKSRKSRELSVSSHAMTPKISSLASVFPTLLTIVTYNRSQCIRVYTLATHSNCHTQWLYDHQTGLKSTVHIQYSPTVDSVGLLGEQFETDTVGTSNVIFFSFMRQSWSESNPLNSLCLLECCLKPSINHLMLCW